MFRSESFIQLVFADPQDIYCLGSGMQLDLNSFLWFQLRKAGYQGIYFVSGAANSCTVESKDMLSFQSFENRTRGGFFKNLFAANNRAYTHENRVSKLEGNEYHTFVKWITEQLNKEDQVFIFRLDTFCAMAQGNGGEALLNRLIQMQAQQTHSKLLLTATDAEKSIAMLNSPVFLQKHEQGYFCKAVYDIIHAPVRLALFDELKHKLRKDILFLNQYSQKMIAALLCCAQNHADVLPLPEDVQSAMNCYIDCWAHTDSIREKENIFGTQKLLSYQELLKWLKNETNWKKLARYALQFRDNGGRNAVEDYQEPELKVNITVQTDLSRKAQLIKIPKADINAAQQYQEICRLLYTPWNWKPDKQIEQYIYRWLTALEHEDFDCDYQKLNSYMKALLFACRNMWIETGKTLDQEVSEICARYDELLQLHQNHQIILNRLSGIQYQNHEDMSDSTELRFNHLITKLQQLEAAIDFRSEQLEELEDALGKDGNALQNILQTMENTQTAGGETEQEDELLTDADERAIQEILQSYF